MHLRSAFASMFVTILACAAARRPCTAWLVHAAAVHGPAPPLVRLGQQSGAARRTGTDRWVPGPPSRPVINWLCMGLFTRVCVMFSLSEADAGSGPDHSSAADHLSDVIPLSSDVTGGGSGCRPQKRGLVTAAAAGYTIHRPGRLVSGWMYCPCAVRHTGIVSDFIGGISEAVYKVLTARFQPQLT